MSDQEKSLAEVVGRLGLWSLELRSADPSRAVEAAAELDRAGWNALWIAGANGPGIWSGADRLLSAAPNMAVATGVASVWGEDAAHAGVEYARLTAKHGKRIVPGFGVSNAHSAAAAGKAFGTPISAMNEYLDALDDSAMPIPASERIIGALGPKMVALAGARAAGVHPFLITPEGNARNRVALGANALIATHLAVVLDENPSRARETARRGVGAFFGFPSYGSNLRRLGFTDDDLTPGGSDRLIDAVVAWGGIEAITQRVRDHLDAGANHVALHVLTDREELPLREWRELAPLLRTTGQTAAKP